MSDEKRTRDRDRPRTIGSSDTTGGRSVWGKHAFSDNALIDKDLGKSESSQQASEPEAGQTTRGYIDPPYNPQWLATLPERSGTHAVACEKKARYTMGFGFEIVPHERYADDEEPPNKDAVEEFWFGPDQNWYLGPNKRPSTPSAVLTTAEYELNSIGWGTVETLLQRDNTPVGLAHVPAHTIRKRDDKPGFVQIDENGQPETYYGPPGGRFDDDKVFVDQETGKWGSTWGSVENPANELMMWVNYSPLSLWYGTPSIISELQTLYGDLAARKYNSVFFENDGVPRFAVLVEGGELTDDAWKEITTAFDQMRLEENSHRAVIIEAIYDTAAELGQEQGVEITLEPLTVGVDEDAAFLEYRRENEHDILKVHEVPEVVANRTDSVNYANAREQRAIFAQEVIRPIQLERSALLHETIHSQMLDAPEWTIDFELKGADLRDREAEISQRRVKGSQGTFTVNEARSEFGYEPLDGPDGEMLLLEVQQGGSVATKFIDSDAVDEFRDDVASETRAESLGYDITSRVDTEAD